MLSALHTQAAVGPGLWRANPNYMARPLLRPAQAALALTLTFVGVTGSRLTTFQPQQSALLVSRRAAGPMFAAAAAAVLTLGPPQRACAKYGDSPKTELPTQPESTLGSAAQDVGSRQVWDLETVGLAGDALKRKKVAVMTDWAAMSAKAQKQLAKRQWVDLQSTLALRMTDLKSKMRDIARSENGGDLIVYKEGSKDQPIFDYNLGRYDLTEEAMLVEKVVAEVNRCYVAAGRRDAETADEAWAGAQTAFTAWSATVTR